MISEEVIIACQSYDQKAQLLVYETYAEMVMCVCKRYSNSQSEAEDIFQDAFLHLFKNISKFDTSRGVQVFAPWLRRVVANIALEHLRIEKKHYHNDIDATCENLNQVIIVDMDLDIEKVFKYLQELPLMHKTVFNLYAIEGYDHNEISELLKISASNSRSYLSRARKQLVKVVQQIGVID